MDSLLYCTEAFQLGSSRSLTESPTRWSQCWCSCSTGEAGWALSCLTHWLAFQEAWGSVFGLALAHDEFSLCNGSARWGRETASEKWLSIAMLLGRGFIQLTTLQEKKKGKKPSDCIVLISWIGNKNEQDFAPGELVAVAVWRKETMRNDMPVGVRMHTDQRKMRCYFETWIKCITSLPSSSR